MGGGGVMRAAAKVATFGVNGGGMRAAHFVPAVGQSMAKTSQNVSKSADCIISSSNTEGGRCVAGQNLWDNDWEFAEYDEDLDEDFICTRRRLVFGGVPTEEEAKEATDELKDALEKVYLSPNSTVGLETKDCVAEGNAVAVPPKHALQAFVLLNESSAVQDIVASLATDKNVWNAMMQNEKIVRFFQTQQTTGSYPHDMDLDNENESFGDNGDQESTNNTFKEDGTAKSSRSSANGFGVFMENVKLHVENAKLKVTEMVMNMSDFIQNLFGKEFGDEKHNASGIPIDKTTVAASFMGLVMLVIMVVLMKRV